MSDEMKKHVRNRYGQIALGSSCGCGPDPGCCPPGGAAEVSGKIGYSPEELASLPAEANLGLGCGNPVALAALQPGQTVLDLGSGAGIDCFLAANQVGPGGRVIGVDMTAEMLEKARHNGVQDGYENVEFRLGEIEHLPVADNSIDVVISNCVVNLSPDKRQVFREVFRALKPGGRLMVSDIVLLAELPEALRRHPELYTGCVGGADLKEEYLRAIAGAGFSQVEVVEQNVFPVDWQDYAELLPAELSASEAELDHLGKSIASIKVAAVKPN